MCPTEITLCITSTLVYTSLLLATPSTSTIASNILPSLSDLDLTRLRSEQAHSHAANTSPLVSLERGLEGAGLHRILVTTVRRVGVGEYGNRDDRVLVVENVTRDMYIDLDQMSMDEFGPEILSSAHMDTEKPASASDHHVVFIYAHLINNSTQLRIPVHFRYQAPSPNTTYKSVTIPAPLVFIPHPLGSASLPCHPYTRDTCLWELVASKEEDAAAGAGLTLQVPCGQQGVLSHVIVGVTILVTLIGAVFILWGVVKMDVQSGKDQ